MEEIEKNTEKKKKETIMNNIDEMPPKCHDCPYWEIAEKPYVCSECRKETLKTGGGYD